MLQALLHGKLDRWLKKDAYSIEDLLTSVVLGSAAYEEAHTVLVRFLSLARDEDDRELADALRDLRVVDIRFWPTWGAVDLDPEDPANADVGDDAEDNDDEGGEDDVPAKQTTEPAKIAVSRSQPEVVVELERADGTRCLLLIEAKLWAGKSSHAIGGGQVNDQLGRYWLQLREEAKRRDAQALGVIYLTTSSRFPREELETTQRELKEAGCGRAPLYWLSWRSFAGVVPSDAPRILLDCAALLRERWQLVEIRMAPWPIPPTDLPAYTFRRHRPWPATPTIASPWRFTPKDST